jgi:glycine/D-amino acid oxidase-like deaminating enzyme
MVPDIFHRDFTPNPYWWEAYTPTAGDLVEVPKSARVAIVGGGYAGLSTALELARHGIDAVVLEAKELGSGASTRNGGAVSGGVNVGKSFTGRTFEIEPGKAERMLSDASDAFALIDRLISEEEIDCFWEKHGRFVGSWTIKHFAAQAQRLAMLNSAAQSGAYMVPRERQREEIASDYYFGGMVVERSGKLHPALYYKGLLEACRRRSIAVCAKAAVERIERTSAEWRVDTSRGKLSAGDVVIATNGYTGNLAPALKRRVVPLASHIIATEELPEDFARSLIPKARTLSDTKRVLCYYRMSPDGKRMVFGGRARFTQVDPAVSAPILHRYMTDRFPQLRGVKVTHAWTGNVAFTLDALPHMGQNDGLHYCLG